MEPIRARGLNEFEGKNSLSNFQIKVISFEIMEDMTWYRSPGGKVFLVGYMGERMINGI